MLTRRPALRRGPFFAGRHGLLESLFPAGARLGNPVLEILPRRPLGEMFSQEHQEIGDVRLVSVVFGESDHEVRAFFTEHGGSWPALGEAHSPLVEPGRALVRSPGAELSQCVVEVDDGRNETMTADDHADQRVDVEVRSVARRGRN